MPKSAKMIRVMIASPGDVPLERQEIRKVVHEWNDIHAEDRSTVLLPVGWETHSSPEMGDRAQAIISKQILRDCDLLVAVFWTKLGSPTGASASGTVEEIEEHLAAGKPAMLYFSSAPVQLRSVNQDAYNALLDFKAECFKRGLVQEYESISQFRELFTRQLAQTIIRKFGGGEADERGPPTASRKLNLSREAQTLLQFAAESSDGVVLMLHTLSGLTIQAGQTAFAEEGDARSSARWRAGVLDLNAAGLIEDRSGKGEVFFVTGHGYDIASVLGPYKPDDPESPD